MKAASEPEPAADQPESAPGEPVARRRGIRRWALSGLAAAVLLGAGTVVALRPFDGTDSSGGG
ncbi:hypothetical protein ACFQ10_29495 [Streptomyces indonesiensis]